MNFVIRNVYSWEETPHYLEGFYMAAGKHCASFTDKLSKARKYKSKGLAESALKRIKVKNLENPLVEEVKS